MTRRSYTPCFFVQFLILGQIYIVNLYIKRSYIVNNYYEDDIINEGKIETLADVLAATGRGLAKTGKTIKQVPLNSIKKHTLKNADNAIDFGKLTSFRNLKANPKRTLRRLTSKTAWKNKAKDLKSELYDKTRLRAKVAAGGLAAGMAANEVADDFENVKAAGSAIKKGAMATVKLGAVDVPRASARALSLIVQSAAAVVGGASAATAGFNSAVDSGRITGECLLHPTKCRASIVRAISNSVNTTKSKIGSVASGVKNSSTTSKVAAGAAAVGGAVLAAKLIKDALEKKDWYNNGCSKIEDSAKKAECLAHVDTKVRKELTAKMKRCKLANNPERCVSAIKAKLNELG